MPNFSGSSRPIISFWHEDIFILACWAFKQNRMFDDHAILISQHRDAELALGVLNSLGLTVVRGSSTRGYISAMREISKLAHKTLIVIPDGPRGPPRVMKSNLINIAKKLGRPLHHFEFRASFCIRLKTWDKLKIPLPFTKILLTENKLDVIKTV
ncbi:MAG: DUF374 domain-containing protein [Deltaproteobacteria bacterium]|nr:DUF374 domain-containing protein [Deltaproteobacteria bacterium]